MSQNSNTQQLKKVNPWLAIWTRPRQGVRAALAFIGDNYIHRMMIVFGDALLLAVNLPRWLANGAHPVELMLMFLVFGPILGVIGTYILSAVTRFTGKWFGGIAPKPDMLVGHAWAHQATVLACLLYAGAVFAFYKIAPPPPGGGSSTFLIGSMSVLGVAALYASVIRILVIAEIHMISIFHAIIVYFASQILILTPFIFFFFIYFILFTRSIMGGVG